MAVGERTINALCNVRHPRKLTTIQIRDGKDRPYPPILGAYGLVSPRTCPDCGMEKTVWAELTLRQKAPEDLSEKQYQALMRILHEPDSLLPENKE